MSVSTASDASGEQGKEWRDASQVQKPQKPIIRKVILHDLGDGFYQATWYYEQNGAQAVHTFPRELGYTALVTIETLHTNGYPVEPFELFEILQRSHDVGEAAQSPNEPDKGKGELERRVTMLLTVRLRCPDLTRFEEPDT